jgi:hypothetical protein
MIENTVEQIKSMGEFLIDYTFPEISYEAELLTIPLRDNEIIFDGYEIRCSYNKSRHDDHYLETLQIIGKDFPFLPFNLVCNLAKVFLGEAHLSFIDLLKDGRKIYIWTCRRDFKDKKIPPKEEDVEEANYEGFHYHILKKEAINFL